MFGTALRTILVAPIALALSAGAPTRAADGDVARTVLRLQASAVAVQDAPPRVFADCQPIFIDDVLSTGRGGRLEVRMINVAVMTLGERSSFVVIGYIFSDGLGNGAMRLLSGALLAKSGEIAKQARNPFEIAAKFRTTGICRTTVWGGLIDVAWGVVLLDGAGVSVENGAGRADLTEVTAGIRITSAVKRGRAEKLARAKRTVSFQ